MTIGTAAPYLERPVDINTSRPGYFHDVFHLVRSYIELLKNIPANAAPGKGLIKLYSYRTGTLDIDTTILENNYHELVTNDLIQKKKLQRFGKSLISYNITALYQVVANTISKDLIRSFGDDNCLSAETIHALNHFAKFHDKPKNSRVQLEDSMDALVETTRYNAIYRHDGVSSSQAIIRAINTLDRIVHYDGLGDEPINQHRLLNALKIVFYIGCRYYHVNILSLSDEVINRSYDRLLKITDFTLAAVPFDPTLVYNCSDETSSITRWGIEYIQSLGAVLLYSGGIRYQAIIAIDANGNKGVTNV